MPLCLMRLWRQRLCDELNDLSHCRQGCFFICFNERKKKKTLKKEQIPLNVNRGIQTAALRRVFWTPGTLWTNLATLCGHRCKAINLCADFKFCKLNTKLLKEMGVKLVRSVSNPTMSTRGRCTQIFFENHKNNFSHTYNLQRVLDLH